jgi:NADPH:quinone reductase-like Zn-dependent oxidoreductase
MAASFTGTYRAVQLVKLSKTQSDGIDLLELNSLPRPSLSSDEIRVRVHAAALNFFDLLMLQVSCAPCAPCAHCAHCALRHAWCALVLTLARSPVSQGKYQYRPPLPFTVGSEASGVIIEVGSAAAAKWKVGDAVIVGMTNGDSMAEEIVTQSDKAIKKPGHFTHAEAAGLPVGFFTNWHALVHRGKIQKGEFLLVTGAGGGMGLSAVQLGVALGCRVIAAASTEEKLSYAKKAGAHFCINYSNLKELKDKVSAATDGHMADVIYEVVGGDVFTECIRCIAGGGRLLVVGFASGKIPSVPANMILVKGFSVVGVRSGQEVSENSVSSACDLFLASLPR